MLTTRRNWEQRNLEILMDTDDIPKINIIFLINFNMVLYKNEQVTGEILDIK